MMLPTCRLCARGTTLHPLASRSSSFLARRVLLPSPRPAPQSRLLQTSSSARPSSSALKPKPSPLRAGATVVLLALPERLSHHKFTPVKILSVTKLTPETSLFKLALPKELLDPTNPPYEAIQSLFVMQPDLQIQRAYTPLCAACFDPKGPAEVDLIVKRYADGEASRYIHRLGPGDQIKIRGPVITWYYGQKQFDEVVFIVGGTGISPALQYIESTLSHPANPSAPQPSIKVHPKKLSVQYLVDNLEAGQKVSSVSGTTVGRVRAKELKKWIGEGSSKEKKRAVIVCGPEQMVNAVAGPRARDLSQGPVGGMLGQLGYSQDEVVKL
ncbi:hypothetical protein BCR35DRAFT_299760 [Leucosporidium creatinivorum]|uniref:FAD-binding FR-type domain-containing protein n=1 Tax=Leucosporidium creatinivorum TaxID=106004 RepID=A0A1Y2G0M3_9BASI|nr:hypothetical protein BCR35DRAFT_299760 [Leucosporidium creatinivorum]